MYFFIWSLFGMITGFLMYVLEPSAQNNILYEMGLGLIVSLLGGLFARLLFGFTISGINIDTILFAVSGAIILLFLQRFMKYS